MSAKYAKTSDSSRASASSELPILVSTEFPHEYAARERASIPIMGAP